jgi:hypothetical protein
MARGIAETDSLCGYSKNVLPALPPSLWIDHVPASPYNSITTPFENLAAARWPRISMSWTVAPKKEFRNADVGRVHFLILTPPTRWQAIRSQSG